MNFMVSSLSNQEMFGPNSEKAVEDLYGFVTRETGNYVGILLKELAAELADAEVMDQVLTTTLHLLLHLLLTLP